MSRHYLIDGYNVLNQIPRLMQRKLEDARAGFVHWIQHNQPQGSSRNSVTIVFDGQPDVFGSERVSGLKIIFTSHESADDKIKSMVSSSDQANNIIVVTDDRDIQYSVRACGAQIMPVAEFLAAGHKPQGAPHQASGKVSPQEQKNITDELAQIWLKNDKET